MVECKFCDYSWKARVDQPKECPRCKNRLDYDRDQKKTIDIRHMLEQVE
jgi:hypothetical protein